MIKVLFICHGNICRSPMAEFIFRALVKKEGLADYFEIASAATSGEALGLSVHRGTRKKLAEVGISTDGKRAVQMTRSDYRHYDYLIGMDDYIAREMQMDVNLADEPQMSVILGGGRTVGNENVLSAVCLRSAE